MTPIPDDDDPLDPSHRFLFQWIELGRVVLAHPDHTDLLLSITSLVDAWILDGPLPPTSADDSNS